MNKDLSAQEAVDYDPFAGEALLGTAPSTAAQREIWAAVQMGDEASCAFNESNRIIFKGTLQVDALAQAWQSVVDRHEALRTTFSADGMTLLVSGSRPIQMPVVDLSTQEVHAAQAKVEEFCFQEVATLLIYKRDRCCARHSSDELMMTTYWFLRRIILFAMAGRQRYYSGPRRSIQRPSASKCPSSASSQAGRFLQCLRQHLARGGKRGRLSSGESYWLKQFERPPASG
ncbi:MAG: condensation domain-containing protein [Myxococcota bacterium]